jgi:hypothetical protein
MMRQSLPECNPLATSLTTNLLGTYLNEPERKKNDPAKSSSCNRERSGFLTRL